MEKREEHIPLDEAMSPVKNVIHELYQFTGSMVDEEQALRMDVDQVKMEVPVELDVYVDENGRVTLGTSSRHTSADVSFEPVLHQLKLTIEREE